MRSNNAKNKLNLAFLLLLCVLVPALSWYSLPEYSYSWDPHNKLVQSWSLWQNGFHTDELFYYFSESDPDYSFFPHGGNAYGRVDGRYVSAFPVPLAALYAPFAALLGPSAVHLLSSFFLVFCCWTLYRFWDFRGWWILTPLLATFLLSFTLEFSEHLLLAFLTFLGISLFLRKQPVLGALLVASGVLLRHETLVLLLSLGLAGLLVGGPGQAKKEIRRNEQRRGGSVNASDRVGKGDGDGDGDGESKRDGERSSGKSEDANIGSMGRLQSFFLRRMSLLKFTAAASFVVLLFAGFNWWAYGHALGPRYLINAAGLQVPFSTRLDWAVDLLLWHQFKPGLFGYMPALALVLISAGLRFGHLPGSQRMLFLTVILYIPIVLLIVPNNGIMDWGPRYFGPVVLPSLALAHFLWKEDSPGFRKGFHKAFQIALILLSLIPFSLNYAGLKFLRGARKVNRTVIEIMKERNADLWVFAGIDTFYYSSTEYIHRPIITLKNPAEFQEMLGLIGDNYSHQKVLFVHLKAPEESAPGSEAEAAHELKEVQDMQIRNSFTLQQKEDIQALLRNHRSGELIPGLYYIEGTVQKGE